MSRRFYRSEVGSAAAGFSVITTAFGTTAGSGGISLGTGYTQNDVLKLVKKGTADSTHILCALGDQIEAVIASVDLAPGGGFSQGTVQRNGTKYATADGIQADGTGSLSIGDQVVCGTVVALGTALSEPPRVRKATIQVGTTVPADLTAAAAHLKLLANGMWTVVSLGTGAGVAGTAVLIERAGGPD